MKKIVLVLAVLMLAVPAMAGITITASQVGSANSVTLSYARSGADDVNLPRAFALDVRVDNGKTLAGGLGGDATNFDPNFYVAPGTFTYDANTGATNWGNRIAVSGPNSMTIEMGSLYATNDSNHPTGPNPNGTLMRFGVPYDCNVILSLNSIRGGVVMESTAVTFPPEYVTLVGVHIPALLVCTVPNVVGMWESVSMNASNAMTAIEANGFTNGTRTTSTSATVAAGKIISTSPVAGQQPGCGTAVNRTVSTGPLVCATCPGDLVPDLSLKLADMYALRAKLVTAFGRTGFYQADKGSQVTGDQWHICGDMIPDSSLKLADMYSIRANLVDGFNKTGFYQWPYVPNVVGMTRAAACTAITAKKLTCNPTDINQCSNTVPAGSVISSNPAYPTLRNCNTSVQLTVSTGPCP